MRFPKWSLCRLLWDPCVRAGSGWRLSLQPMGDLGANQKQVTLLKYTLLPSAGNLLQQTCMATTAWWWCRCEVSDLQSNAWPAGLPSNSSFLLPFLQGPLWEQDHRPPPGCVWRPVHPTAPVRTQPRVFLGGVLGGGQYASGLSDWPSWPLWGWGSLEARSLEDLRPGSAVRGYGALQRPEREGEVTPSS